MENEMESCLKRPSLSFPEEKQPLKKRRIIPFENSQASDECLIQNQFTVNNERNDSEAGKLHSSISISEDILDCGAASDVNELSLALKLTEHNCKIIPSERKQNDIATSKVTDISESLQFLPDNVEKHELVTKVETANPSVKVVSEPGKEMFLSPYTTQSESEFILSESSGTSKASSLKRSGIRARRKLVMSEQENFDEKRNTDEGNLQIIEKNKTRRKRQEVSSSLHDVDDMLQGMDGEIENILEETALKNKLTTTNVKNILRHVITNECVLSMVRNTMNIDNGNYDGIEEAVYEPKLTRSKARELMEKQVVLPWPVSPLKTTKTLTSKKLLEEEFSEDESSDEEYKPNSEAAVHSEDDDDGLSSHPSDIGSPECSHPNTPRTPVAVSDVCEDAVTETVALVIESPSQKIDKIALRTRSKLPLNNTPLEEIEASFVAPDITLDMYDSECDDENWNNFLNNFCKPLDAVDPSDIADDDANDPEYNFLEEEDVLDEWDFRNDRAVKISKKELSELMAELLEAAEQELAEVDDEDETNTALRLSSQQINASDLAVKNVPATTTAMFSHINRDRLNEQMRMHVQLLTQEYLLSMGSFHLKEVADTSYKLLEELYRFGTREFNVGQESAFYSQNLEEAWKVVSTAYPLSTPLKDFPCVGTAKSYRKNNWCINSKAKEIIANSKVFIYPELLPICGFSSHIEKSKVTFTRAEDHLIALGLEQFHPIKNENDAVLIRTLLLPTKTDSQIRVRIKNVKSSKTMEENPIKYYFKHNVAPPVIHVPKVITPGSIVAPCKQPPELVPEWMKPLLQRYSTAIAPSPVVKSPVSPQKFSPSPVYVSISSNNLAPHIFMKTTSTLAKTPEKRKYNPILPRPVASYFGTSRTSPKHISPLKQISPILKKYGYQRRVLPRGVLQFSTSPTKKANDKKQSKNLTSDERKKCSMDLCEVLEESVTTKPTSNENEIKTITQNSAVSDIGPNCETGGLQGKPGEVNHVSMDDTHSEQLEVENASQDVEIALDIDSHCDIDIAEENGEGEVEDEVVDDESDLAALMAASSTICKKQHQHPLMRKKNKQQKELESTLALLAPDLLESDPKKEEREVAFVHSYLLKVKETLKDDVETYEIFLKTLCEFENSNRTPTQLYESISTVLNGYPALVDDFVGFLLPEQAKDCGRMAEYFTLNKIRMFLRKLEVHFGHQPQHIQRILKTLSNLQWQLNLNSSTIRLALQPLLRGQSHLLEEFLQLLPNEPPPESLMTDFEEITIPDSEEDYSNDSVEEITIPDYDNKYGGKQCPCSCHAQAHDIRMQNRIRHCIQCGIKFLDGRIYIQTGKVLKPAQVIYYTPGTVPPVTNAEVKQDDTHNNCNSPAQQGSESPLSSLSPSPVASANQAEDEAQEECEVTVPCLSEQKICCQVSDPVVHSATSQTDKKNSNVFKDSASSIYCSQETVHTEHPLLGVLEDFPENTSTTPSLLNSSHVVIEDAILPPETSKKSHTIPSDFSTLRDVIKLNIDHTNSHRQRTRPAILRNFSNISNEMNKQKSLQKSNSADMNVSTILSDRKTAVTSSATMEPASSPNRSERSCAVATCDITDTINTEAFGNDSPSATKWTRDEDKVLLETCQKMGTTEGAFMLVAQRLKNKNNLQVADRFQELMKLFTTHDEESDLEDVE